MLIAVLAIVASKYLVTTMVINREFGGAKVSVEADAETMTARIADEIVGNTKRRVRDPMAEGG